MESSPWVKNVDADSMEEFLEHICQKKTKTGVGFDYYCDPPQFQSYQHINGYKSAILYKDSKVKPSMAIKDMFSDFINDLSLQ